MNTSRTPPLSDAELERYSRHLLLPEFNEAHQLRLRASSALIVGIGGLGGPAAMYLAASGIGRLFIADDDVVDLGNLQRQIVHDEEAIGLPKVDSARKRLLDINHEVSIEIVAQRLAGHALGRLVDEVDIVIDASDNFTTRYDINRACRDRGRSHVYGAAIGWRGHVCVFSHEAGSPCLECLFAEHDEAMSGGCAFQGVYSPLPGLIGTLQASEAIKVLTGIGRPLIGELLCLDLKCNDWRCMRLQQDSECLCCQGEHEGSR